jgi:DHA2 family multidrug resistance protein
VLALFLWIELTSKKPLLNLRLLFRRNFGFCILANFLLGIALYGSVFTLPVYLSRVQGYISIGTINRGHQPRRDPVRVDPGP